ncbi:hypothetical protein P154DRAFT_521166 [Amniculicola lignicola CBS 123094]|uniref:Ribosomal protein S21 n=1 Tax=Amniculicola lignicola CBS 123094 TaxID=1392246 RepID=A0A6A5WMX5_9PLEO|nr:hypothetical protein P154DRAFT_521166 [Amniculicola lignicola CBS 123094]
MLPARPLGTFILRPTHITHQWTRTRTRTRTLTTTPLLRSAQPQPSDPLEAPTQRPATDTEFSRRINDLFVNIGPPRPRPLEDAKRPFGTARKSPFGDNFSPPPTVESSFRRRNLRGLDTSFMDDSPSELLPTPPIPAIPEAEKKYERLGPSRGRTVELDPARGRDLVRGIGMLGSLLARNKVRADFMKQRYHERPGLKRKRLNSERWRARFKVGFNSVVMRVSELTKKGW